jgi:hypothetical protein
MPVKSIPLITGLLILNTLYAKFIAAGMMDSHGNLVRTLGYPFPGVDEQGQLVTQWNVSVVIWNVLTLGLLISIWRNRIGPRWVVVVLSIFWLAVLWPGKLS